MNRILPLFLLIGFFSGAFNFAQNTEGVTHSGQKTGQPVFPVETYQELPNPIAVNPELWKNKGTAVSWGSIEERYKKEEPAHVNQETIEIEGWRGERVAAQWVFSNYGSATNLSYDITDLKNEKKRKLKIDKASVFFGFVRYVMTDELNKDKKGACGYRTNSDYDSTLVADPIDHLNKELRVEHHNTQGVWVRLAIPSSVEPGLYKGDIHVYADGKKLKTLKLKVKVKEQVLAPASEWDFHLDLWQNPYAVARYYQVRPWSAAHFEKLKETMQLYADAGGDVITVSIIDRPWDGQTHDPFGSMVTWMKRADGSWYYDYTIFDKWVELMMDLGVDKQINLYSMIPWELSFQYYDQATNKNDYLNAEPGDKEYEEFWGGMLSDFAQHLKEKGWFEKTFIAMDERTMEAMQATLKVIKKADPDFKVSLAGDLHAEIEGDIDDYCLTLGQDFSEEVLKERKAAGKISTFYTSCAHAHPNSFTFSAPAESEWIGWHAAATDLDGFLRWAYNSWVLEPLLDSRFTTWAAGDTYFVYPGGRTSIRFERLISGIQYFEKINQLKKELKKQNNTEKLEKLSAILAPFEKMERSGEDAAQQIKQAKGQLAETFGI